jgi:MFS family permease
VSSNGAKTKVPSERGYAYLFGVAAMTAGMAMSTLDATGITTHAGHRSNGAIYTSLYLAILMLSRALAVPYSPRIAARLGTRRTFRLTMAVSAIGWGLVGVLILSGLPAITVLLSAAVVLGMLSGIEGPLSPIFARAYLKGKDMSAAYAYMSVVAGVAWAVGSASGGFILNSIHPGWGLVIRSILQIPLIVVLLRVAPAAEPKDPRPSDRPWRDMRDRLTGNSQLRRAALLGCGLCIFAVPMVSLIVPIVDALRQTPLLPGAGIVMASMAIGQLTCPYFVAKLGAHRHKITAASAAALVCGVLLLAYGCAALAFSDHAELGAWALVGFFFGGMRFTSRALNMGAVAASDSEENSASVIAAFTFITGLVSPVGVLLWGVMVNRVSPEAALLVGGACTILMALRFHPFKRDAVSDDGAGVPA